MFIARRSLWALLVCVVVYVAMPDVFFLDDGYISVHSADVVLAGSDAIFRVPALVGVTSPAYVALLVLLRAIRFSDLAAIRVAGSIGASLFVYGVWYLGRSLSVPRRATLTLVTLTSGFCWLQLSNGLETGWAMAILVWLIAAAEGRRLLVAALLAGLLPFFRPDLAPAAALLLVWSAVGSNWRDRMYAWTILVVVASPWLIWMHHTTGSWTPQTIEAKRLFFAEGCRPLAAKLALASTGVAVALFVMLPLSIGAVGLVRDGLGTLALIAMATTVLAYVIEFPGSLVHNYFRYLYPILVPWLAYGMARMLPRLSGSLITVLVGLTVGVLPLRHFREDAISRESVAAAHAVDSLVPDAGVVLVHDAGAISVFAHRRAVDLVGLKTPASLAAHKQWTWPSCGADRAEAIADIVNRSGAGYLVTIAYWNDMYGIVNGLRAHGFVLEPVRQPPIASGYTIWRLAAAHKS